jgi:O-antigen/teichoic acid export membrane protein
LVGVDSETRASAAKPLLNAVNILTKSWRLCRGAFSGSRPVASTSLTVAASQVLLAVGGVVASRHLGPSGRGIVTGVLAWGQTLPLFALAGLNSAVLVRIAESGPLGAGRALGNSAIFAGAVGGGVGVIALLIVPRLVGDLGPHAGFLSALSFTLIPIAIFTELLFAVQVGLGRITRCNAARIWAAVLQLTGTIMLAVFGLITPTSIVVLTIANGALAAVLAGLGLPWRELAHGWRELLEDAKFGARVAVASWVGFVNLRLDVLVMSGSIAAAELGYYGVANNAMLPVTTIASAAAGLLTPAVARIAADGRHRVHDQLALIRAQLRRYGLMSLGGGVLAAAVAPIGLPLLFGSAFKPAVALTWILIPGFVGRAWSALIVAGAVGMRRARVGNLSEGAALVVTAVLLPILLPRYQASGAAIASTAAYLAATAVCATWLWRSQRAAASDLGTPRSPGTHWR